MFGPLKGPGPCSAQYRGTYATSVVTPLDKVMTKIYFDVTTLRNKKETIFEAMILVFATPGICKYEFIHGHGHYK